MGVCVSNPTRKLDKFNKIGELGEREENENFNQRVDFARKVNFVKNRRYVEVLCCVV